MRTLFSFRFTHRTGLCSDGVNAFFFSVLSCNCNYHDDCFFRIFFLAELFTVYFEFPATNNKIVRSSYVVMKNRGPYTTKCSTIEIESEPRWRMYLSGAAAAMNVALKMKNLFNNACTFHHKSYVIFSFSRKLLFRTVFHFDAEYCVQMYIVLVFGGAIDCWCEYSRTLATGWSVHTNTNFAYPSIAIYCRHSHSASLHLARTFSPNTLTHSSSAFSKPSFWFGWLHTALTLYVRTVHPYSMHTASNLYIWEKFSIYHRRTDKLYSDENGWERKLLNQTRLKKKIRNKITKKKHRTWNKNYWKEMQLYETSRRADERERVCVALRMKWHWSGQRTHTHTLNVPLLFYPSATTQQLLELCFYFILNLKLLFWFCVWPRCTGVIQENDMYCVLFTDFFIVEKK